ncbi:hypothetical protein NDU88_006419 [Pleurodeles waltl]|uniref:Uncharacterized protein n=1 Tax=Pleurodeles waltl TaxID=8319 RepID=A0AAV7PLD7_PLEWA|nr:hypothetical protein NDU88_006419 [Pleurodeles waltl]
MAVDGSRKHRAMDAPWGWCEGRGGHGEQCLGMTGGERGLMMASAANLKHGELRQRVGTEPVSWGREATEEGELELDFEERSVEEGELSDGWEGEQEWWGTSRGGGAINPVGQSFQEPRKVQQRVWHCSSPSHVLFQSRQAPRQTPSVAFLSEPAFRARGAAQYSSLI